MKHAGTFLIGTMRLFLRKFEENDVSDAFVYWAADPAVQHEYGEPTYETADAVRGLLRGYIAGYSRPDYYRWAIIERETGHNIGQIAFCRVYDEIQTAEIEYCISPAYWGYGFAGEALASVIATSFANTGFQRFEAFARAENRKSVRVLKKSCMHPTDTVERFRREGILPEGELCFCINRDEFRDD